MKSRRRDDSEEDDLTISRRNTRPKISEIATENPFTIPIEITIEIFSRLPVRSISKCRCVSKLWRSVLRLPEFTDLFLAKSSTRPQLLFALQDKGKLFLFSTSLPRNPDEYSSPLAASYHMKIPFNYSFERFSVINGLIFLRDEKFLWGRTCTVSVICNPSTGQSLTLPDVETMDMNRIRSRRSSSYFGFDPVEKQYKVLSMTSAVHGIKDVVSEEDPVVSKEHQVLTLGTGDLSWRMIECGIRHYPLHNGICIGGVLYYPVARNASSGVSMIVCFDVRTEEFRVVGVKETLVEAVHDGILVNYNGKVGALNGTVESIKLWVLEDAEKEEWSEHTYVFSESCRNILGEDRYVRFVGVTRTNEIVLSPYYQNPAGPFYIYYFNIERNTVVRVEVQGMEAFKGKKVYTLLDFVEDVKLLQKF